MSAMRLITAEDLFRLRLASDPRLSPDGRQAVFALRVADARKNAYWSHLWRVGTEPATDPRSAARQFTQGEVADSQPRWSPDGRRIAFVRLKDRRQQIWLIPADGGEAQPLTDLPEGAIGEIAWAPDAGRLAFTFRPAHPDFTQAARKAREATGASTPARHITRLRYRLDGVGWLDERQHIWICDSATGATTQLTDGPEDDAGLTWSPDGRQIAFFSNRSDDPEATPLALDLWLVPADPPIAPTHDFDRLTTPPGPKSGPTWSPDGRWLAYTGYASAADPWLKRHGRVWVVPAAGDAEARCLTAGLDRGVGAQTLGDLHAESADQARWADDSTSLFFLAGDRGGAVLYRAGLADETPVALTDHRQVITGFSVIGNIITAIITTPTEPGDVHRLDPTGARPAVQLTDLHADLLAETRLVTPEEVWIDADDGARVQGWLLRPPISEPGQRHPAILSIHGGPHAQYGHVFFHELQWLAAQGYVVLAPNPRGSSNLGEEWMTCVQGAWGDRDQADLLAAADFLTAQPDVDPDRVAVCGGSYGGYSTTWLIGHTDRFRCAISDRCLSNFVSWNGQTDMPMQPDGYLAGNPWDAPEAMRAQSPLTYIANCVTPTLIIHSEGDWRCPIGQAQELYYALKRLKRANVELVWHGTESSHGLSRNGPPDLRLDRLQRYLAWFARYLQPGEETGDAEARQTSPLVEPT